MRSPTTSASGCAAAAAPPARARRLGLEIYRGATALECLLGYLHVSEQPARLAEVLDFLVASGGSEAAEDGET